MAQTLCLLIALVFAVLSATGVPEHPRWRFLSGAIAFLVLGLLLGHLPAWSP